MLLNSGTDLNPRVSMGAGDLLERHYVTFQRSEVMQRHSDRDLI